MNEIIAWGRRLMAAMAFAGGLAAAPAATSAREVAWVTVFPREAMAMFLRPGPVKVDAFWGTDPEVSQSYVDYYEGFSAPAWTRFAQPFVIRYARNYVEAVEYGPPVTFNSVSEYHHKGEQQKLDLLEEYYNPRAVAALNIDQAFGSVTEPGERVLKPEELQNAARMVSAVPHSVTPAAATSKARTEKRRLVLMRRPAETSEADFVAAVATMAGAIARSAPRVAVSYDVMEDPAASRAPADAVIWVGDARAGRIPTAGNKLVKVTNIVRVDTRTSFDSLR